MEISILKTGAGEHEKVTPRRAYSIQEIAASIGVSENFLRQDKNLRKIRLKRRVIVLAEDLESYLKDSAEKTAA